MVDIVIAHKGAYLIELLRGRLPIGTPAECAKKLRKLQEAGIRKSFLWPIEDEVDQLRRFQSAIGVSVAARLAGLCAPRCISAGVFPERSNE